MCKYIWQVHARGTLFEHRFYYDNGLARIAAALEAVLDAGY